MRRVKVAGYGRSSTDKQQFSPEVQEDKIRRWFNYHKEQGKWPNGADFIGMYIDQAVSSRIDMLNREKGYEVLTKLDHGDVIVCATMSRAFRSAGDAEKTTNKLQEAGISLEFVDCSVNTSSPEGKMFLGMIAIMARFERDVISERTKDTLRHKRLIGESIGAPPYGWKTKRVNGRPVLIPDVNRRMVGIAAMNLFRQGMSRDQVAIQMKHYTKQHAISVPCSSFAMTCAASAACLDFPKLSRDYCRKILNKNLNTIDFIRGDEHEFYKTELGKAAEKEGLKLWENVSVVRPE